MSDCRGIPSNLSVDAVFHILSGALAIYPFGFDVMAHKGKSPFPRDAPFLATFTVNINKQTHEQKNSHNPRILTAQFTL